MQKVKVHRYVSGKRPDYAPVSTSEDDTDSDGFVDQPPIIKHKPGKSRRSPSPASEPEEHEVTEKEADDPRLRRLQLAKTQIVDDAPRQR